MSKLSYITVPFEVKAAAESGGISGYGSTFGNVDYGKDVCVSGCFKKSLDYLRKSDAMPGMFWQHNPALPVGEWQEIEEDKKGLYTEGQLWVNKGIPEAERSYLMAKSKGPKGFSIGFIANKYDVDSKKGIRMLTEIDLKEISIVTYPMNPKAAITGVKMADGSFIARKQIEDVLSGLGFLNDTEIKLLLDGGYDALTKSFTSVNDLKTMLKNNIAAVKAATNP